jgi:hypothetical protein
MSETISERKEASTIEQRARWEAMEFEVRAPGVVRVENVSYGDDSDKHVYLVIVEDGETVECTCPADRYQDKCKHRHAVEDQEVILDAASASEEEMRAARKRSEQWRKQEREAT